MNIVVRVKTGAHSDSLVQDETTGEYTATVRARPIEGEANKAIIELLSDELGVPKTLITLISGQKSRLKRFEAQI